MDLIAVNACPYRKYKDVQDGDLILSGDMLVNNLAVKQCCYNVDTILSRL